jgi:Fatty acid cis/trans isomerase (CTI)
VAAPPEIDTFLKGPVCNGSIAVNSIQEQFFAFFLRPDADDMVMLAEYAPRAPGSADARGVGKRCDPRRNSVLPAPRTLVSISGDAAVGRTRHPAPTIRGMTVVDRTTISGQFLGRFHAHGAENAQHLQTLLHQAQPIGL